MPLTSSSDFDGRDLRRTFGSFATGVTIVTTMDKEGQPCGFTANSFTSVSIDPPLLLVSIAKSAFGCQVFTESKGFAVNILSQDQRELSNRFASAGTDKFSGVEWSKQHTDSPILDGSVSWFDCHHHDQVDAGDHILLVGHINSYDNSDRTPLGFCRGAYMSIGLSPQILEMVSTSHELEVGVLVENMDSILLQTDLDTGEVNLPMADDPGDRLKGSGLLGRLWSAGISIELSLIYSVYEDVGKRKVFYLCEVNSISDVTETRQLHFVDFDHIPWDSIKDTAVEIMLKRFIRERQLGNHAIYVGDHQQGEIFPA